MRVSRLSLKTASVLVQAAVNGTSTVEYQLKANFCVCSGSAQLGSHHL